MLKVPCSYCVEYIPLARCSEIYSRAYVSVPLALHVPSKHTSFTDGLELMFVGIGFVFLPIVVLIYKRINAQRDVAMREMEEKGIKYSDDELRRMGDRAPDFRYTL